MKTICRLLVEAVQSKSPRITALAALTVLTLATVTGCIDVAHNAASIDPSGVYTLVSVDGKPVPCEVIHGKTPMTIKAGVFTIETDGTCQSLMRFSVAGREDVNREVKASYSRNGGNSP